MLCNNKCAKAVLILILQCRIATLDLTEDSSSDNLAGESDVQLDILVSADHMPSTDEEGGSLYVNEGAKEEWSNGTEKCMFANREVETVSIYHWYLCALYTGVQAT